VVSLLKLMEAPFYAGETYVVVPDYAVPYIMALAGGGLWAELRGRAELC